MKFCGKLTRNRQEDRNSDSGSPSEQEEEDEISEGDSSDESDDDDEPTARVKSYSALMRSLSADVPPQAKRRKIQHESTTSITSENGVAATTETVQNDDVDEVEEGPETATEGVLENDDEDGEDDEDPFGSHFANPDENVLGQRLKAIQKNQWTSHKVILPGVGRAMLSMPQSEGSTMVTSKPVIGADDLKLKQKLVAAMSKIRPKFNQLEQSLASLIFGYQDTLFCERNVKNAESLRRLACLHAVNHVFKYVRNFLHDVYVIDISRTRDRVIKNNARLAREDANDDLELRDQGFTRPKVLMILPTRDACVKMVDMIATLCEPEQQENRKRFDDGFLDKEEKFSDDKADDFRDLFGGNDDDMFRLGLKFTRRTIKYFSQFYNSDIIFASPLGLRMALEGKEDSKGDSDFLSSIEVVIVDHADALLMQNWEHVEYIFEHLNLQPKDAHGCDFSRVRSWYLDNNSKYFRQTIALSSFNTPEINTLFYNRSINWSGKVKISASYQGTIQELGIKVKQTFSRLESPSFATDPDSRFTYFTTAIVPALLRQSKSSAGTLIFIPSYLDFVRVRNYFLTSNNASTFSFGSISEYTSVKDVARARSHFINERHAALLYTERAHHFRRYQLKGVKKIIMYGLPDNPIFYKEIVGGYLSRSVQDGSLESGEGHVRVVFSKWDLLKLERVAGSERVGKMIKDKGDTFDFV